MLGSAPASTSGLLLTLPALRLTAYCLLPTAYCLLLTAYRLLLTASRAVVVKFRPRLRSIRRERALLAHRVRTDEDPVLPGGQAAEDFGLHRLRSGESEVRFHAGERVGRQ